MSDFDKNIKIPEIKINTGKITAAVTKANEVMSDFLNNNPFSEFDRIANDIRDRVDNAIAMEFTKYIGELLRKNGVVPKITEYTRDFETDNTFETRYGVSIDELDFSEHDKVFEDKIASLEKQIEKLEGEKSFLRTRCMPYVEKDFDNGLYGKLAIVSCNEEFVDIQKYAGGDDLYSREVRNLISEGGIKRLIGQYRNISASLDRISAENKELKQRIAELESKETEKPTKINLNDRIKVKLTPLGAEIYYHMFDDTNKKAKKTIIEPHLPKVDEKGYTEFTLWGFINTYGQYIDVGKPNVIDPIDIIACE